MKLNYKRTLLIGLAFMSICAFWQMYDNIIPLILQQTFHMNETLIGVIMAMDNVLAVFLLPFLGSLSDKVDTKFGKRTPFIVAGTALAILFMSFLPIADRTQNLVMFVIALFFLLISMGLYRSPAVALMPDLTPKPLRSQANALINLMGTLGGVYTLLLISLLVSDGDRPDYTPLFIGVGLIMVAAVVLLVITIREKKLAAEIAAMEETAQAVSGAAADTDSADAQNAAKASGTALAPEVKRSLFLILLTIFLWFMGYNAVTTAFSRYARNVWGVTGGGFANCLMVATVAAVIGYVPIGQISAKVGRKKCIQGGLAIVLVSFLAAAFFNQYHPIINVGFVLIGLGSAAVTVNTLPMVVEMCKSGDVGKYTGLYYTFSMSAQIVTPILSGAVMQYISYRALFPYCAMFVVLAILAVGLVKHGDNRPEPKKNVLENFDVD